MALSITWCLTISDPQTFTSGLALGRFAEDIPDFGKLIDLVPKWANYYRIRGPCFNHTGNQRSHSTIYETTEGCGILSALTQRQSRF
jgi:hypothetical protein